MKLLYPPEHFDWPANWQPFADQSRWREWASVMLELGEFKGDSKVPEMLPAELQRECCPEHPLYGRTCVPVAAAVDDPNEFLFITNNPAVPIAFVHLTWSRESTAAFPYTVGYATWEEFHRAWIKQQ
jgi:hypothetical protein